MNKSYLPTVLFSLLFMCAPAVAVCAATPSVVSFTASPSAISNNYAAALNWQVADSYGVTVAFSCVDGVSIKSEDGVALACNTRKILSGSNPGSAAFTITNVSGTSKNITATLYPKSADSVDYDSASAQTSVTVGTSIQPITSVAVSTTTVSSGGVASVTWTGVDVPGANIMFDCHDGLSYFKSDGVTPLTCGVPAFTGADFPQSGSASFVIKNDTFSQIPTIVRVVPVVVAGAYDATHSVPVNITVSAKQIVNASALGQVAGTPANIASSVATNFSWTTQNAIGANLTLSCNDSIIYQLLGTTSSTTQIIPCGSLVSSTPLSQSGSISISFNNLSRVAQPVNITILPQKADGTYDGTRSSVSELLIMPPAQAGSISVTPLSSSTPIQSSIIIGPVQSALRVLLTSPLDRGSRGVQVTALQKFLAQDIAIYPEGSVTGYFGPATARAVGRFQERYSLAKSGDAGYGFVGPKTRAALNSKSKP